MFFSKTNYSHYAIRVDDVNAGTQFYYDSTGAGARKRSPCMFLKHYRVTKEFEVSKEMSYIAFFLEFWAKHANKGYGFIQIVGLAWKIAGIIKAQPIWPWC